MWPDIRTLFPARLEEERSNERANMHSFLTVYATIICDMARERGFRAPSPDSVCDVMIQSKEDATCFMTEVPKSPAASKTLCQPQAGVESMSRGRRRLGHPFLPSFFV